MARKRPEKSSSNLWIGLGLGALALVGTAAAFAFGGGSAAPSEFYRPRPGCTGIHVLHERKALEDVRKLGASAPPFAPGWAGDVQRRLGVESAFSCDTYPVYERGVAFRLFQSYVFGAADAKKISKVDAAALLKEARARAIAQGVPPGSLPDGVP